MTFPWTEQNIAMAKTLYIDRGFSAADTAKALGPGCTRNSVVGKAHRLGWNKLHRMSASQPTRMPPVRPASRVKPPKPGPQNKPALVFGKVSTEKPEETAKRQAAARAETAAMVQRMEAPANDHAIPLVKRSVTQCAWPVGVPVRPAAQMVCGAPIKDGASKSVACYCPYHGQQALSRQALTAPTSAKKFERSLRRYL